MNFLFIVQGEGRGHLTQAITLEKRLTARGHQVVEIKVGKSRARRLPAFFERSVQAPVTLFESPNVLPTPANRQANLPRSIAYSLLHTPTYLRSIRRLHRSIEASGADVVVNFYEVLTGLAYLLCRPSVPLVYVAHPYLFLHRAYAFPAAAGRTELALLRFFTRLTCIGTRECLALLFRPLADDTDGRRHIRVVPPLLRREVMNAEPRTDNYIHGYMMNAGFSENVERWHRQHPEQALHFFWDRPGEAEVKRVDDTLTFQQRNDTAFLQRMAGCRAYATTAGFESVCEALYLGKPVLMVPVHIEQECNAHEAARCGAGVRADDFDLDRLTAFARTYRPHRDFARWVQRGEYVFANLLERNAGRYAAPPCCKDFRWAGKYI